MTKTCGESRELKTFQKWQKWQKGFCYPLRSPSARSAVVSLTLLSLDSLSQELISL
jgi:hypothetical protein